MNTHLTPQRERWFLAGMLVVYVALSLGFSLAPIFEGWDEPGHYRYTTEMIRQRALPDPFTKPAGEFQQAPLYYFLMIPPVLLAGMPDVTQRENRQNPFFGYAWDVASTDNKNLFIHPAIEVFPFTNDPVAFGFHLVRLTSLILNLASVLIAWRIFKLVWPDRPDRRLAALGVVAFTPVFVSLSGLINNDNLGIFLAMLALYLLLVKPEQGFSWRWALGLGLTLGAGLLTKSNLVFLAIPTGIVLLIDRRAWKAIPVILLVVAAVAGWYYARNAIVYHDVTGIVIFEKLFPDWVTPPDQITIPLVIGRLYYLYLTYWAHFGYNIIEADWPVEAFFAVLSILTLLSLPMLALRLRKSLREGSLTADQKRHILIVGSFGLGMVALVLYGSFQPYSLAQGRYVLPILAATAAAIVLSLELWLPARIRPFVLLGLPVVMAGVVAVCLFGYYYPAFEVKPVPAQIEHPLALRYGDVAELIGTDAAEITTRPGQVAHLTLYWRALAPAGENLHVAFGTEGSSLVSRESLPGAGKLDAREWTPGQTWSETYVLPIPASAAPGQYPITVMMLVAPERGKPFPVSGTDGQIFNPVVGAIVIAP